MFRINTVKSLTQNYFYFNPIHIILIEYLESKKSHNYH